jgi:aryl-alcohol dehydrogenase-like predicted oxidoreductase
MELRPLGGSGLAVTPLGLGTRGHRAGLRDTEPADAERAIYAAIDAGCGLIECGPRWGESERLVGAAVRDLRARDRVVVATRLPAAGPRPPAAAAIVAAVDASLRATRSRSCRCAGSTGGATPGSTPRRGPRWRGRWPRWCGPARS